MCVFYRCFVRVCGVCVCVCVCTCGVIVIVNSCVYEYYYDRCDIFYIIHCLYSAQHTLNILKVLLLIIMMHEIVMNVRVRATLYSSLCNTCILVIAKPVTIDWLSVLCWHKLIPIIHEGCVIVLYN